MGLKREIRKTYHLLKRIDSMQKTQPQIDLGFLRQRVEQKRAELVSQIGKKKEFK